MIFFQVHLARIAPTDPAFITFTDSLKLEVRAIMGKKGHEVVDALPLVFGINQQLIPDDIKQPRCNEREDRLIRFSNEVKSSANKSVTTILNSFIADIKDISTFYKEIHDSILEEPTVLEINDYKNTDIEPDYGQQLEHFACRSIDQNYLNEISE